MVYRANRNLTKMTDASLNVLVIACVARGIDFDEIEKLAGNSYVVGRKSVKFAAAAIDLLAQKLVVSHRIPPSAETLAWSFGLEGGHTFHEMPDIEGLLFKQLDRLLVTT